MRVYLPLTVRGLTELQRSGRIARAPLAAHAMLPALRRDWAGADDEELEYAVLMAAAFDSLARIAETDDTPRRVVVVADVDDSHVEVGDDLTAITVTTEVPLALCAALHLDDSASEGEVAQALLRLPEAVAGDGQALGAVSLTELELMWFATQEIGDLLG